MHPQKTKNWKALHQKTMIEILGELQHIGISGFLGLKGGTALFFFHGLSRFSVDLDFDYKGDLSPRSVSDILIVSLSKKFPHFTIEDDTPDTTLISRIFVEYGGPRKLKIEISWPVCVSRYEERQILSIPVRVMSIESMFTHKLIACYSRFERNESIANRDLFDIDFLFSKNISIDEDIVLCRTSRMNIGEMNAYEYISFLKNFLEKKKTGIQKNILLGIGDLIESEIKKTEIKKHLFHRVIHHLDVYLFTEKNK